MKKNNRKLRLWQDRYEKARSAYDSELQEMDEREKLYKGSETIKKIVCKDNKSVTKHVRNICMEIIEAQVNSTIPQPKVTAKRKEDEHLARKIENMLRNETDRLPFESMNDQGSRTVPIQGGTGFLVEWDETKRTHTTQGDVEVNLLHPKMIIPQEGVLTGVEDMDYIFVTVPQTKEYIKAKYGVSVYAEDEEDPDLRDGDGPSDELVTQIVCYFRNDKGGIGKFSWVGETVLEDLDNYQARRVRRCAKCGAIEPLEVTQSIPRDFDPDREEIEYLKRTKPRSGSGKLVCQYCGSDKFEDEDNDFEELEAPIFLSDGSIIPPYETWDEPTGEYDDLGQEIIKHHVEKRKIPYYCPNMYPVVLWKNTSVYGKFLGGSDIDPLAYYQNTTNRIEAKIIDKLLSSGSVTTLPARAEITDDGADGRVVYLNKPSEKELFGVYDLEGNISQDLEFLDHVYEEARQTIGVTDAFQGRHDPTATSGKAKEFAAAQSAGRLESKREMRDWAWSNMYELVFKHKLAYADEPRPIVSQDSAGNPAYEEFNRYDFLRQDDLGNYYWNDDFLFSCDVTTPLANNREAMWQENRLNFQSGAYGDPNNPQTLILFWQKMAQDHYPGAQDTVTELQKIMNQQMLQQQMLQSMMNRQLPPAEPVAQPEEPMMLPPNMQQAMERLNYG